MCTVALKQIGISFTLVAFVSLISSVSKAAYAGDPTSPRGIVATKHPTIALALGGGGIRGTAHIGVLRVFEREDIPIDYIAGSSMGAVVGGLYAAGVPLDQIESSLLDGSLQRAYAPGWVFDRFMLHAICKLESLFKTRPCAGLYNGNKFVEFLDRQLPENKRRVEDTNIPFCAVCTNLCDGRVYRLCRGDLSRALVASSALPSLIRPVEIDGNLYVDGAVRCNLPTVAARQSGATVVIAVPVDARLKPIKIDRFNSIKMVARRVSDIVLDILDDASREKADFCISPEVSDIGILSKRPEDVQKAIRAGEVAATAALPEIRKILDGYTVHSQDRTVQHKTSRS